MARPVTRHSFTRHPQMVSYAISSGRLPLSNDDVYMVLTGPGESCLHGCRRVRTLLFPPSPATERLISQAAAALKLPAGA